MSDPVFDEIEVKEAQAPDPIPEGLYKAVIENITAGDGNFGAYYKITFLITEGDFKDTKRNLVASKKITKSANGKNSKLFNIIRTLEKKEPAPGEKYNVGRLLSKPCQILVKNDKVINEVQYQVVAEVMSA
ncbi:hypothetical protein A3B46_03300 [Candidatus Roizmanbacteria bacterium RIFCSPLOWO2_01_FULL_39_19]|nr:MAG: hypothetical protein A3B46_03300 [Candidatus Roizmanbacteria bacterium RIFCSPLOWO2_01_FULL_39_19]